MIFLPAGRSSTSTPVSPPSSSGSTSRSRPSPPGKSVDATSSKCSATAAIRVGEAALHRCSELVAQVGELLQALLEVLALGLELHEPFLLRLVLLLRERVDLAELDSPQLEALRAGGELVAVVALGRLRGRLLEPAARVCGLRLDPGQLDLDLGRALRRILGALAQLDLGGAELS